MGRCGGRIGDVALQGRKIPKHASRRPRNGANGQNISIEQRLGASLESCYRSAAWARKQQLQSLGALQERSVGPGSVAGALRGPRSNSCSAEERCSNAAWAQEQHLQRLGALLERCVGPEGAVAASSSCSGQERRRSVAEARK